MITVFTDAQCPNIGGFHNQDVNSCKAQCIAEPDCNAINIDYNSKECYLRKCPSKIPFPEWDLGGGWRSFWIKKDTRVRHINIPNQLFNWHFFLAVKTALYLGSSPTHSLTF